MARKPDVQYIRFETDGSSARAVMPLLRKNRTTLPRERRRAVQVIRLDPLAFTGIVLSLVMVVLMVVSCFQLSDLQKKTNAMDDHVDALKGENARLTDVYHSGYDLDDVEQKALALGMIPESEVRRVRVDQLDTLEQTAADVPVVMAQVP